MQSHKNCTLNKGGFTLVELVVSLGILVFIFGLGSFVSMDVYRAHIFASEKTTLLTILQKARSQAQNHIGSVAHGVYIAPSAYILFSGSSYDARDISKDISFPVSPSIHESGLQEVVFVPLTAQVELPGDITLMDSVRSGTLSINEEGRIDQ